MSAVPVSGCYNRLSMWLRRQERKLRREGLQKRRRRRREY